MARADGRRGNADLRTALIAIVLLAAYVRLLTRATTPVVTALSGLSSDSPLRYAALLVFLVGLPGLLFTLPRALERRRSPIAPVAHSPAQLAVARMSHMRTDVLGVAAFLLAQVPLPAPWSVAGKAATIEAVTMSPQIVALSQRPGAWSIVVFAARAGRRRDRAGLLSRAATAHAGHRPRGRSAGHHLGLRHALCPVLTRVGHAVKHVLARIAPTGQPC